MNAVEFDLAAQAQLKLYNDGAERIANAFLKLRTDKAEHPMSFPIFRRIYGEYFMNLYKNRPETEGQRNHRRRREPASLNTTKKELSSVLEIIKELRSAMAEMHRPSIEAIGGNSFHSNIEQSLSFIQNRFEHPQMPETFEGDIKGRPADLYPLKIAEEVGRFYRSITGVHPTLVKDPAGGKARGPYIDVLTEVFDVLHIDASPEGRGAEAIKAIEKLSRAPYINIGPDFRP